MRRSWCRGDSQRGAVVWRYRRHNQPAPTLDVAARGTVAKASDHAVPPEVAHSRARGRLPVRIAETEKVNRGQHSVAARGMNKRSGVCSDNIGTKASVSECITAIPSAAKLRLSEDECAPSLLKITTPTDPPHNGLAHACRRWRDRISRACRHVKMCGVYRHFIRVCAWVHRSLSLHSHGIEPVVGCSEEKMLGSEESDPAEVDLVVKSRFGG